MRGRTRKANTERYANGKPKAETVAEIKSVVMAQRMKEVHPDDAGDALAGYTLGRLLLNHLRSPEDPAGITREQHWAGEEFYKINRRHSRIVTAVMNSPRSPLLGMVSWGISCEEEPTPREIAEARDNWRLCHDALIEASRIHGMAVIRVTYGVCVENWPLSRLSEEDYGSLKIGLNALGRVLR